MFCQTCVGPTAQTACPICDAKRLENLNAGACLAWRCVLCGFTWIDRESLANQCPPPSYEEYGYNQALRNSFDEMKPLYVAGLRQRVARTIGLEHISQRSFVDVGCANGEYLSTARELGFGEVAGVEIDTAAASRAAKYGYIVNNLGSLKQGHYDVIQVKNVITNIQDVRSFLTEVVAALKEGGYLYLDVLNTSGIAANLRTLRNALRGDGSASSVFRPPYVINAFNRDSVDCLLHLVGLRPVRLFTSYCGSRHVPYHKYRIRKVLGACVAMFGLSGMLLSESVLDARKPL